MKYVYAGTGNLSSRLLSKLSEIGLIPSLVLTDPPKPKGRGKRVLHTDVFNTALSLRVPVLETDNLKSVALIEKLNTISPDFLLVFDYGHIIGKRLINIAKTGSINVHPSLLPFYRGPAPIIRAMMDCRDETGVSIIELSNRVDCGDILLKEKVQIGENMIREELEEILLTVAVGLIKEVFHGMQKGTLKSRPQLGPSSYAPKLERQELFIDWNDEGEKIKCKINALSPLPGARTFFEGRMCILVRSSIAKHTDKLAPGEIKVLEKTRLVVGTGSVPVIIHSIKLAGKRLISAAEFINGYAPFNKNFTSQGN